MATAQLSTPIGPIEIRADNATLVSIRMGASGADLDERPSPLLLEAIAQLDAWFAHRLRTFSLPLAPSATARGAALRQAICEIPYGNTASYGEVAHFAQSGPRAIGQACRRNPFPIIVPCHRVIAARQAIGYYSGGNGVVTKRWLLEHEQRA